MAGRSGGWHIEIEAAFDAGGKLTIGESVAVNGVCLTVAAVGDSGVFAADVSQETARRTTIAAMKRGDTVDLERAIPANGRFGGHFVQGHVDCKGRLRWIKRTGDFATICVGYPTGFAKFVVSKGSIAIDGVSLTVSKAGASTFEVAVIPETIERTILANLRTGSDVNLEFDIMAKYIESVLKNK